MTVYRKPCNGCGEPLSVENAWMEDGCPCNSPMGVNSQNETRWLLLHELQQRQAHHLRAAERDAARYRGFRSALINSDAEEPAVWIQDAIGNSVTEAEFDAAIDSGLAREDAA
jgi:hypothetical protein